MLLPHGIEAVGRSVRAGALSLLSPQTCTDGHPIRWLFIPASMAALFDLLIWCTRHGWQHWDALAVSISRVSCVRVYACNLCDVLLATSLREARNSRENLLTLCVASKAAVFAA